MKKGIPVNTVQKLIKEEFFESGDFILDIGCGNGRFAADLRGLNIRYVGLDPIKNNITDALYKFRDDPNFCFRWFDVENDSYNPSGRLDPYKVRFPFANETFNSILCHSVFTHLGQPEVAEHYISEIKRVLKPQGKLWITFFKSPPNEIDYGTDRTVYFKRAIDKMLDGFEIVLSENGESLDYNDQWEIGAVKCSQSIVGDAEVL